MKRTLLFICSLLFSFQLQADDLQTIRENYLRTVLYDNEDEQKLADVLASIPPEKEMSDQVVVELHQRYTLPETTIRHYLSTLQPDGSWSDIDYADQKRSGWNPKVHADRILALTKVYSMPRSAFYRSDEIGKAIRLTMNFWFDKKLHCPNWWYNQIGIPKTLGPAFLLFEDQLSAHEKQEAIRVMENSRFGMTGQNKVWLAGNVFVRALLQHDFQLVKAARDTITSEIVTGQAEGIKEDWSFHQHGAQQQFGNYGAAYISGMATWSTVFAGTSLAFSREELNILHSLLTQGYRRISWKGNLDVNVLGRQFFHNVQRHKALTMAFAALALSQSDPVHKEEYKDMITENFFCNAPFAPLTGLYHFWKSDLTNYRTPNWMGSVKMASTRVIGGESGNGDNMKGYYLADGATYTYVDGNEYTNIYPCWDWRKIPGITSYDTRALLPVLNWGSYKNNSPFAGNVTNGAEGLTAMVLDREGLQAHKAWIFTPDYMVCLGSAISSDSNCAVATAVDQRLKRSDLLYLQNKQWVPVTAPLDIPVTQPLRFFHDRTGYIILTSGSCTASAKEQAGSWHEIMELYSNEPVRKEVVSLYLNHGASPHNEQYSYLILPASTAQQVKDFPLPTIRVIRNDADAQVVALHTNQTFFLAVYSDGAELKLPGKLSLSDLSAGLYLIKNEKGKRKMYIADPTQQRDRFYFKLNGKSYQGLLPAGEKKGTTVSLEI